MCQESHPETIVRCASFLITETIRMPYWFPLPLRFLCFLLALTIFEREKRKGNKKSEKSSIHAEESRFGSLNFLWKKKWKSRRHSPSSRLELLLWFSLFSSSSSLNVQPPTRREWDTFRQFSQIEMIPARSFRCEKFNVKLNLSLGAMRMMFGVNLHIFFLFLLFFDHPSVTLN